MKKLLGILFFFVLILVLVGCGSQDSTVGEGLQIRSSENVGRYAICDTVVTAEAQTGEHLHELMAAHHQPSYFQSASMWQGRDYQVVGEVANTFTVVVWVQGIPASVDFPEGADGGCFVFVTTDQITQETPEGLMTLSIAEMRYNSIDLFPGSERARYGG